MCEEGFKKCSKCGEVKPVEWFSRDKSKKGGRCNHCKACRKQYHKQYREENKEAIEERMKLYRGENKEYYAEYRKRYYEENREHLLKQTRQYGEDHKEQRKQYIKKRYEENRGSLLEYAKQYREENKEAIVEYKKQYYQTPEGKDSMRRHANKRRGFGYSPINKYFKGAKFHHLHINFNGEEDHNIGIFIPTELHNSVSHNSFTWDGMEEMNDKAIEWYNENYNVVNYIDKCNSQRSLLDFY